MSREFFIELLKIRLHCNQPLIKAVHASFDRGEARIDGREAPVIEKQGSYGGQHRRSRAYQGNDNCFAH